ncbi:MAG: bifunctional aldolase/short-chain dehydrogenase [Planctomycetota bacterium]
MKSRWTDDGAREAVRRWGEPYGGDFALRLYSACLIGEDAGLVVHGGGNVSIKRGHRTLLGDDIEVLHVKASGWDLASIEPKGMPAIQLAHLRRLLRLVELDDQAMVNEIRTHLLDADAPTPSMETLLHAALPHRFVDHSHADAVLSVTNQPRGAELSRAAMGEGVVVVPYVKPGFALAQAVAVAMAAKPDAEGIVLLQHGLVTFADDARTSYERHVELVDRCERFLEGIVTGRQVRVAFSRTKEPAALAAEVGPMLRGLLAHRPQGEDGPIQRSVLEWRGDSELLSLADSDEALELCRSGPLTSDHLIRTKARYLYVPSPKWGDAEGLRGQLGDAVTECKEAYRAYAASHTSSVSELDAAPRVVLLPGAGLFCWGATKRDARIAADIAEHTLRAKLRAFLAGGYESLPNKDLAAMEFRDLQRAKLGKKVAASLAGQVVLISGGAGAIGVGIAEACAEAGAHVALCDVDADRASNAAARIERQFGPGRCIPLTMDVTDERSVREGFDEACRFFGGVDVVVPNAGVAHVSPLADLAAADFRRLMEVNATGCLLVLREGAIVLQRQGLGGNVVIVSSKNVLGPGKDFGAYSASKAAAHQLGKVAAIEFAPHGVRVNMLTPDAVFGDEENPSGLWRAVGPERAKSRRMNESELPEYYRQRTLLKTRVTPRHVGLAVVFFASNATPTTGATLPIDGGVVEAFPR